VAPSLLIQRQNKILIPHYGLKPKAYNGWKEAKHISRGGEKDSYMATKVKTRFPSYKE